MPEQKTQEAVMVRPVEAETFGGAAGFGARPQPNGTWRFVAWAPEKQKLSLVVCGSEREIVPMKARHGFHIAEIEASAGTRYLFRMPDGREFPDPASRFQPAGVHGASATVDTTIFEWTDGDFRGYSLEEMVIYELHTGTFTREGTLDAAIPRLRDLAELGITAVEVMPVAQFPGARNWGYDGVFPYAVQNSYGGPDGFNRFVDAAHGAGISVILDVVYNHLGPEGNYFSEFGPFFTRRYGTPWGQAINFDGALSDPVRDFFIENAIYWLKEFHVDGLRLDAVHGIFDFSAHHFLAELKEKVAALASETRRPLHVIAESDLNDVRLLKPPGLGGYGLDAQWSDDFHHALHALLTGERNGYYADFGSLEDLGIALRDGWRYSGEYSRFRKRRHGNSPAGTTQEQFVVFSQNHDQVGNRAAGERLASLVDFETLKLVAGLTLLSPFVPMLFMGEEYGEKRPFQYFTSHGDADLIEAVRRGRREEFSGFGWAGEVPDPQSEKTFADSMLDYEGKNREPGRRLWSLYQQLIALRKRFELGAERPKVWWDTKQQVLTLKYADAGILVVFHFGRSLIRFDLPGAAEPAEVILNSTEREWRVRADDGEAEATDEESVEMGATSFMVLKIGASAK